MFTVTSNNRRDIPVFEQIVTRFNGRIDLFGNHKLCFGMSFCSTESQFRKSKRYDVIGFQGQHCCRVPWKHFFVPKGEILSLLNSASLGLFQG